MDSSRNEINSLNCSQPDLQKTKGKLEAKRDRLLQGPDQVNQEIDVVNNELSQVQKSIEKLEKEKQERAHQAYQLHKSIQPIPGSAEDDNRAIQEADEIRLRAMNVIQNSLGPL